MDFLAQPPVPRMVNETRNRNNDQVPDERYDSLNHMMKSDTGNPANAWETWEIAIANGDYDVFVAGGDPDNNDQVIDYLVEGVNAVEVGQVTTYTDPPDNTEVDGFITETRAILVTVNDGRLTVENGPRAQNNKICFLDVYEPGPAPQAPTLSAAPFVLNGSIELTWNNVPNEFGYVIERKTSSTAFVIVGGARPDRTSFIDEGLDVDTEYTYRVSAYNHMGQSASNEASAFPGQALRSRLWQLYR
jgi:hypothetical protein